MVGTKKKISEEEEKRIVENLDELTKGLPKDIHFAPFPKARRKLQKIAKKIDSSKILTTLLMLVFVASLSIGLQYAFAYLGLWLFGREAMVSTVGTTVFSAVTYLVTLIIVLTLPGFLYKKWKTNRDQLGLNGLPTWTDIGLAPIGFVVMLILTSIVTAIFSFFPWFEADQTQNVGYSQFLDNTDKIIAFVALVVVAPIVEEIIFRGWLYGKLRKKFIMPVAIFIVSLLFGIVHLQWNVGVNVFATSIVLCLLREVTGTVYSGILLHMLKNGVAFFLIYVLNIVAM